MNSIDIARDGAFASRNDAERGQAAHLTGAENFEQRTPLVTQILTMARRRKWVLLGAIAMCLALALLATILATRQYTATALLEIQRETASFADVGGDGEGKAGLIDQEFYETQYGLLRSQALAERVARDMRLYDSAAFFDLLHDPRSKGWYENGRATAGIAPRAERIRVAGDILIKRLSVQPERLSRLVRISFSSPDPALSKRVIDMWSRDFIQVTLERRYDATSYARKFLESRLAQLRTRIDESERKLVGYASREGIINLPGSDRTAGSGGERSLVATDLEAINQELTQAMGDRVRAESRLNGGGGQLTEALGNSTIGALRERRANLAADYAKLLVQFEPQYPPALALKTQIDQIDGSIRREESRVGGSLQDSYRASVAREGALKQRVSELKSGVLDLRRRSIQYSIFERDVDTNRQLYDALLQRYKAIGVSGGVGVNNISIVDPAEPPRDPSSPKLILNMAIGLLAGIILGVGAMLALEQIDQGIADPSEVEQQLGVPLLGTVPKVAEGTPVEALRDRKSSVSEAYQSLRTNLAFSTDHGVPRTLAVTSSRPAEGKTTTSLALAQSLARGNRRVLLIDGDMRSPSIHHIFGASNAAGLSNYLSGENDVAPLIQPSGMPELSIMAAGPQPPSASELLSGDRLAELLRTLIGMYDHVVIDSPPVMGLADAPLLGSRVEGTVFVIESHATQKTMAKVALTRLAAANGNLLGAVLTKFDPSRAHYGYGYDYGYGYGYGDTAKQKG